MKCDTLEYLKNMVSIKKQKYDQCVNLLNALQSHLTCLEEDSIEKMEEMLEEESRLTHLIDTLDEQYNSVEQKVLAQMKIISIDQLENIEVKQIIQCQEKIYQLIKESKQLNNKIIEKSEQALQDVKRELNIIGQSKQQSKLSSQYLNPYQQASQISYFIDKKK